MQDEDVIIDATKRGVWLIILLVNVDCVLTALLPCAPLGNLARFINHSCQPNCVSLPSMATLRLACLPGPLCLTAPLFRYFGVSDPQAPRWIVINNSKRIVIYSTARIHKVLFSATKHKIICTRLHMHPPPQSPNVLAEAHTQAHNVALQ